MYKLVFDCLVLGIGILVMFAGAWGPGLLLIALAVGLLNGSRHGDVWISYSFSPPEKQDKGCGDDSSSDTDGGGGD